jgi:hypothetical protein
VHSATRLEIFSDNGIPHFFTTFTCNPKWPEIKETVELECGQQPSDRPDVGCRVYHMKLIELNQVLYLACCSK